jgi:DNA anti-recombination protein RmuC
VEALGERNDASDQKTAALAVAVADVAGRMTAAARDVGGLERAAQAAETSAANARAAVKKTEKEHDALLAGVAKAIAALESEAKKQRKEIAAVMQAMDKLAKEVREKR